MDRELDIKVGMLRDRQKEIRLALYLAIIQARLRVLLKGSTMELKKEKIKEKQKHITREKQLELLKENS